MSIRQPTVSLLHRFYSSIAFSKCGKYASKLISCLLILSTLLSFFTFSTYAVDYNNNVLPVANSDIEQSNTNSPDNIYDYSSTTVIEPCTWYADKSLYRIYNTNNNFYSAGFTKTTVIKNNFSVRSNHNYTVKFKFGISCEIFTDLVCYVYVFDGNKNNVQTIILHNQTIKHQYNGSDSVQFDFNLSNANLPSGYTLKFGIDVSVRNQYSTPFSVIIGDISYIDNDDDSGLLNKIITAISVVWQSIKDGFDSMTSGFSNMIISMSNWFTNLGNTISTKFSNMTTSLSNWFAEQSRKIQDFNTSVGNWFADLGNRISGFFVKLYNDIIDGLKRLFIPSDDYFTTIKSNADTFCTDHFGVIYTAPKIMIDIIRLLLNINVQAPAITMPAIEFDFMGKLIHLNDPVTLNFNDFIGPVGVLHSFYSFYRVFVTVLFIFFFIRFCIGKYNVIFGGKGSVED